MGNPLRYTDPSGHAGEERDMHGTHTNWWGAPLDATADFFSFADPRASNGAFAATARNAGVVGDAAYAVVATYSFGTSQGFDENQTYYIGLAAEGKLTGWDAATWVADNTRLAATAVLRAGTIGYAGAGYSAVSRASASVAEKAAGYFAIGVGERFAHDVINNIAGEQTGLSSPDAYLSAGAMSAAFGVGGELLGRAGKAVAGILRESRGSLRSAVRPVAVEAGESAGRRLSKGASALESTTKSAEPLLAKNVRSEPWRGSFGSPGEGYAQLVKDLPKWDPMRTRFARMLRDVRASGGAVRKADMGSTLAVFGGESIESGVWFRWNPERLRVVDFLEEEIHWQQIVRGLPQRGYSPETLETLAKRAIINNYDVGPALKFELLDDLERVRTGRYVVGGR
jgi:hypothetical protein